MLIAFLQEVMWVMPGLAPKLLQRPAIVEPKCPAQQYFQPEIGRKISQNNQPGTEKQFSY